MASSTTSRGSEGPSGQRSAPHGEQEAEDSGLKLSLGRRKEGGFSFGGFLLIGEGAPCPYLHPGDFFHLTLSPCPSDNGSEGG